MTVFAALAVVAGLAIATRPGVTATAALPLLVGFVTWVIVLSSLTGPLERAEQRAAVAGTTEAEPYHAERGTRRGFLTGVVVAGAAAAVMAAGGRLLGGGRRAVEESRRLLRLEGVTRPVVPAAARVGLDGVSPWLTPVEEFYRIDTALVVPSIDPTTWSLRIHGMVERELTIDFADLMRRTTTEAYVTLCCVSNEVGGDLIGNAWWSGVRIADLLAEAGVSPDADAVLQTSDDGWNCGTPLEALTDDRDALLAVAMDGRPLPLEHGFPVRSVVPGLYGYVSATKWVVDMEVTRFDRIDAYWTQRGWGEKGPIKISSRVDVPRSGADVPAGSVAFGGVAWAQHTGISAVEVSVDGGGWQPATIGDAGLPDAWVQWRADVDVEPGDHLVRVRATDADGVVQDATVRDVLPDGATGYASRDFTAS
jgi:DMSO/TMAO reductase YedYZ molybdopterin-dependent catalytic subunit